MLPENRPIPTDQRTLPRNTSGHPKHTQSRTNNALTPRRRPLPLLLGLVNPLTTHEQLGIGPAPAHAQVCRPGLGGGRPEFIRTWFAVTQEDRMGLCEIWLGLVLLTWGVERYVPVVNT